MAVITISKNSKQIRAIHAAKDIIIGDQAFREMDLNPSIKRFNEFWDFMDTLYMHGYTRAAISVLGRAAVGAWWLLRKHDEFGDKARDIQRRRLYSFYMDIDNRQWDNIKDFQSFAYKIMIAVMYLRYFGRAAFEVVRNEEGTAIGMDFLHGLVMPNVDEEGYFKTPAFFQYLSRDPRDKVEFSDPRDVVYIINPDFNGSPMGGSDMEALAPNTLPLDIYLQVAATNYMQNRDRPEVIYSVPEGIGQEAFDEFCLQVEQRWAGPTNVGRGPIVSEGEVKVQELRPFPSALPYLESRKDTREEILAVTGTAGAKMGIAADMSNANFREVRREFHETSMIPIFRMIELGFYEQIHLREFDARGWEFKFDSPDFLNAVERATVDMRYVMMGVDSPNDIRHSRGDPPRPGGDVYVDPTAGTSIQNTPGSPPEGRPVQPDDPSQVGEPNTEPEPPERGDGHDDEPGESALIDELYHWRDYAVGRIKRGRRLRMYKSDVIDAELGALIQSFLENAENVVDVRSIFSDVIDEVKSC